MGLPSILRLPPPTGERPPPGSGEGRYIRSFMVERIVIGVLGLALPFTLVLVDHYVFSGTPFPRASESAYYYSGMREWFTIAIAASGFFLIAYKITESDVENLVSVVAGVAAIVLAIFPTGRTRAEIKAHYPLTPLQQLLGEGPVEVVHFVSAVFFVAMMGGISILFGLREKHRPPHGRFWGNFHFLCAAVIYAALVWSLVMGGIFNYPSWAILAGETACSLAFGASWFAKGFERDYVFARQ